MWGRKQDHDGLVKPEEVKPEEPACRGGTPCMEWVLESRNYLSVVPPGIYRVRICEDGTFSVEPVVG